MEIVSVSTQPTEAPSQTIAGLTTLAGNFDDFLTILTTQLANQDPLDPLDSSEFTSQLVQFTAVEQQLLQNKNLETLIDLQTNSQSLTAAAYLGNVIEANGNTNTLINGEAAFIYSLPVEASAVEIQIFDSGGALLFQQSVESGIGLHTFVWDGGTSQGTQAPEGSAYNFKITAVDQDDAAIEAVLRISGQVDGVFFENGETLLGIGSIGVPLSAVTGIQRPPDDANNQDEQG